MNAARNWTMRSLEMCGSRFAYSYARPAEEAYAKEC
jgi:hypothetical protein